MIVVADAGPIQYLLRIGAIDVLGPLYQRVIVPHTVAHELQQPNTPASIRGWIAQPPAWCEIRADPPSDPNLLTFLDRGEVAAITLALSLQADRLLIDDLAGRREAERRQVFVTGTLGVGRARAPRYRKFRTSFGDRNMSALTAASSSRFCGEVQRLTNLALN
jgi:predicted nucleic acid-binding protein